MSWEAANVPKALGVDDSSTIQHRQASKQRHNGQPVASETVEAALSRLSKAYNSSMECIGAMDKINQTILRDQKQQQTGEVQALASLKHVANAARRTLEVSILLDPLVVPHVPSLHQYMLELSATHDKAWTNQRWNSVRDNRPVPPVVSSVAHKSTLIQLTYLALVNYSDLLQSSCHCYASAEQEYKATILDRGIVPKHKSLLWQSDPRASSTHSTEMQIDHDGIPACSCCCWQPEIPEETLRLAVAALCDASNVRHASDPILWLKLAAASRALERIVSNRDKTASVLSQHRRLQRYALERGTAALPPHLPPNRTVHRALTELLQETETNQYITSKRDAKHNNETKTIDLPRYSWAVLGRILLRVCRGDDVVVAAGSGGTNSFQHHYRKQNIHPTSQFGSQRIALNISPILVLPPKVLGNICHYLDRASVWKFEATCRALSVMLVSARASVRELEGAAAKLQRLQNANSKETNREKSSEIIDSHASVAPGGSTSETQNSTGGNVKASSRPIRHSARSSKRLLSQQISSEKKQDREGNRNSFNYCFLAATLSCTKYEHHEMVRNLYGKQQFAHLYEGMKTDFLLPGTKSKIHCIDNTNEVIRANRAESKERLSDSSLSAFINRWNLGNAGPMDVLKQFLIHVSLNVEIVFSSDPGTAGTTGLSLCILLCFETLLHRSSTHGGAAPCFYIPVSQTESFARSLEYFAMDLLYAELLLRECDRNTKQNVGFDDDENLVSLIVPSLINACAELADHAIGDSVDKSGLEVMFAPLQARCCWLGACFYFWRSRMAPDVCASREAEKEGTFFVGRTIHFFESSVAKLPETLPTPQLASSTRQEHFWDELSLRTLTKFRNDVEASSVVSSAKEQFQVLLSKLIKSEEKHANQMGIKREDVVAFTRIGESLLVRYFAPHGHPDSKLNELVYNFLSLHGNHIYFRKAANAVDDQGDGVDDLIPLRQLSASTLKKLTNPSTLTMLFVCLNMEPSNGLSVVRILISLILTTVEMHDSMVNNLLRSKILTRQTSGYTTEDGFNDTDNDSVMSDNLNDSLYRNADEKKVIQCGYVFEFFFERLASSLLSMISDKERSELVKSDVFHRMIDASLTFSNKWFQSTARHLAILSDAVDQNVFESVSSLVNACLKGEDGYMIIQSIMFKGMVRIITSQSDLLRTMTGLPANKLTRGPRSATQFSCIQRAEYLAKVATNLGMLLSTNLGSVEHHVLTKNRFLFGEDGTWKLSHEEEVLFVRAVMWLRKFSSRACEVGPQANPENICPSYERPLVQKLQIPISTLIVGLCGSSSMCRKSAGQFEDPLGLSEFFDSDASVHDWKSDGEETSFEDSADSHKWELLRVICHAVHCIGITLDKIDDKGSMKCVLEISCDSKNGPPLPLVCTRVLNFFADVLLQNFGIGGSGNSDKVGLWAEAYPYSTQGAGKFLDGLLHKVYRWLYGFVLVGEWEHVQSSGKDLAHTLSSIYEISKRDFRPENTKAAAQLYRCIMRAYAGSRRTPPKAALELVSAAMPPQHENQRSITLRKFIFSGENQNFDLTRISKLVKEKDQWHSPFSEVKDHLMGSCHPLNNASMSPEESEAMQVRRGLLSQLASGPLPVISIDAKEMAPDDDRTQTTRTEEEIAKKFNAILDDICLSGIENCESWYRASQCTVMKADIIADRLGLSLGFGRIKNFSVPLYRFCKGSSFSIEELKSMQEREELDAEQNYITYFGCDLSIFVDQPWSSFTSLKECASRVQQELENLDTFDKNRKATSLAVLRQITLKLEKGDHLGWQEAWGGIFVQALRHLSLRFMSVALYIARMRAGKQPSDGILMSEICEAIGVALYSELMASQRYGWPMGCISSGKKRHFAESARDCFEKAITLVQNSPGKDDNSEDRATWDLLFMIGKCNEKIAFTYYLESYHGQTVRLFERHMETALKLYSAALKQAKSIEDEGHQLADQAGGSAHGSTEVLYRLHASRLKIVLHAVSRSLDELDCAEAEALRLTESHWFVEPEGDTFVARDKKDIRDRIWEVFADIVGGLAECRQVQPFFHRSVYRHAQALMWAPKINDPRSSIGSMNTVPATRSFAIRGLNNSTPAAVSAGVIMSKLFDKKRSQLCAVWVTTNSESSPFQVLNAAIRKYDSLRGKYISAYLEVMNLCNCRGEIETFMKWAYSSKRDLPSYFQASAMNEGSRPLGPHAHDPLLVLDEVNNNMNLVSTGFLISCKRLANSFLSNVLLQEMSQELCKRRGPSSADVRKSAELYLKHAYACYLRLNCTLDDLKKIHAFKCGGDSVHEVAAMCQAYLHFALPEEMPSTFDFGIWAGGSNRTEVLFVAAVEKCKQLFSSLSCTFFSKKAAAKPRESGGKKRKESTVDLSSPTLPSAQDTKKISFEVAVPKGLTTGDTFLTSVNVGNADPIRVKLTVPTGNPSTLRFHLNVPKSSTRKITKKAKLSL